MGLFERFRCCCKLDNSANCKLLFNLSFFTFDHFDPRGLETAMLEEPERGDCENIIPPKADGSLEKYFEDGPDAECTEGEDTSDNCDGDTDRFSGDTGRETGGGNWCRGSVILT